MSASLHKSVYSKLHGVSNYWLYKDRKTHVTQAVADGNPEFFIPVDSPDCETCIKDDIDYGSPVPVGVYKDPQATCYNKNPPDQYTDPETGDIGNPVPLDLEKDPIIYDLSSAYKLDGASFFVYRDYDNNIRHVVEIDINGLPEKMEIDARVNDCDWEVFRLRSDPKLMEEFEETLDALETYRKK